MAGELEAALSGIDLSLNNKESKYRELATLQSHQKAIEAETQKEQQAQMQYQQYEESVNQYSDTLLENDRNAIRKVHNESKGFIREQLKMHGNSYKKFMANGGLRVMANYRNGIVNSEEAKRYTENSKNMARIIQARDSGKANLISQKDLHNLNKYESEGGGDITYSGLLSPIEQIDQGAFQLGTNIPPDKILRHGNNYTAILGNYMREFPEKGKPSTKELLEYTNKKYASVGKNQAMLQYANRSSKAKADAKAEKDIYKVYTANELALRTMNVNADGSAGFTVNDDYEAHLSRGRKQNSKVVSNKKFTEVSETVVDGWFNDVNETRPRGAIESSAFNGSFSKASRSVYADYYNEEDNTYIMPSSQLYGANGHKLDTDEDYRVKPKTVIMAQVGKGINSLSNSQNEEEFIAIEFADNKGHLDEKQNKQYNDSMKADDGSDLKLQYRNVEVWEGEDGKLFYKIMDTESISKRKAYTDAIGDQDDYTEEIESQNTLVRKDQKIKIDQDTNSKIVQGQVNKLYNDDNFISSIYDNIIVKNKLPKQPDIFESMMVGLARANKASGRDTELSANGIAKLAERFGDMIPEYSIGKLRKGNLTMEESYMAMKKGMMDEAESESDKKQVDLFLQFWASTYEAKTKKKLNFKK